MINLYTLQSLFESEGHTSTDNKSVDFSDEVVNQLNLIGNFCTSKDGQERTLGFLEGFCKVFEFLLHEKSGSTEWKVNSDHGGVSTMSGAECIIFEISLFVIKEY